MERNESQKDLKDEWFENHYQKIFSSSAEDALRKLELRYLAKKRFVDENILGVQSHDGDLRDQPRNPRLLTRH